MTGWLAVTAVVVLALAFGVREYLRWRGGRWFGGMRSGSRPDEDRPDEDRPEDDR